MGWTRVLIIDDHEKVRSALLAKLRRERDLQVMGTAASTDGDLEEALKFEPDVVLLDVKRADGKGTEFCRKIVLEQPLTRMLILTSYADEREKGEVRAMGAAGYLLKDLDLQRLLEQISVLRGSAGCMGNPSRGCPEGAKPRVATREEEP